MLRGNYSPFPLFHLRVSRHRCTVESQLSLPVERPVRAEGTVQAVPGPGTLPVSLAAWGPVSADKDISPTSDA